VCDIGVQLCLLTSFYISLFPYFLIALCAHPPHFLLNPSFFIKMKMNNIPVSSSTSSLWLRRRTLLALGAVALLPACGGGSGTATPVSAPTITSTPANLKVSTAGAASFSVTASGSAPLSYQWLKDGKEIPGANAASYSISKTQLADNNSQWQVVVKNSAGSVTSAAATLRVTGIELFAGSLTETGYVDGSIDKARFGAPRGLVFDAADNLYVAESYYGTIRKITSQGQVSTFAGQANAAFPGITPLHSHQFNTLGIMARALDGSLLMVHGQKIQKLTLDGALSDLATVPIGINGDGRGVGFTMPSGFAVDKDGNVYVANGVGTRKVNAQGQVTMLDGVNTLDNVMGTRFFSPRGVALDSKSNLLRIDMSGQITRTAPDGAVTVLHTNTANGAQPNFGATFFAVDKEDDLIVLDNLGLLRRVSKDGKISTVAGELPSANGGGSPNDVPLGALPGKIGLSHGLAIDSKGAFYILVGYGILKIVE
jgi:hypothetical protein